MKSNKDEKSIYQDIQDAMKAATRGKFVVVNAYIKKEERFQINNLTLHQMNLEKEEQTKSKVSRKKEIKIRTEIFKNKIEKNIIS